MERSIDGAGNRSETPTGPPPGSGTDFLQLDPAQAPRHGLADWLTDQLRSALVDGRLRPGTTLPATRTLAAELGVSRGVVTEAYRRLAEDGHVAGAGRRGTVVVAVPPRAAAPGPVPAASPRSPAPLPAPDQEVFDALRAAPATWDLTPGTPDLGAFPRAAWLRAERAALDGDPAAALGYGDPRGAPELRQAVTAWLARTRGIRAAPDEVLIVSGAAQALGLLAQALLPTGLRTLAVEDPGSLGSRQAVRHWGMETLPVPVDEDGILVRELCASGAPAAMLTPAHQFPMGVVLAGARRRELRRWAESDGGLIVEDDYDAEHRYDRPPTPALRAMLPEHVVYLGSASKLLAPGLRIGWLLAPRRLREPLIEAKRYADLGSPVLPQLVLARLMTSGALERHWRQLRSRHRRRRDAMVDALGARLPDARVHGAAAGLHLTVTFPDTAGDDVALAAAALARGVKVHPLGWHRCRPGTPGLVLGYAATPPTRLTEAVTTLAHTLTAPPRSSPPGA
ncbi:MocR-like pyridoxine biosynthesis transcription factor PdxR [Streptomyces cacaoi]